jgi:hypothetical protein
VEHTVLASPKKGKKTKSGKRRARKGGAKKAAAKRVTKRTAKRAAKRRKNPSHRPFLPAWMQSRSSKRRRNPTKKRGGKGKAAAKGGVSTKRFHALENRVGDIDLRVKHVERDTKAITGALRSKFGLLPPMSAPPRIDQHMIKTQKMKTIAARR